MKKLTVIGVRKGVFITFYPNLCARIRLVLGGRWSMFDGRWSTLACIYLKKTKLADAGKLLLLFLLNPAIDHPTSTIEHRDRTPLFDRYKLIRVDLPGSGQLVVFEEMMRANDVFI